MLELLLEPDCSSLSPVFQVVYEDQEFQYSAFPTPVGKSSNTANQMAIIWQDRAEENSCFVESSYY